MTERAHIRSGQVIRFYADERGYMTLATGENISPIVLGYDNGTDKVVPVERETDDTSSGPDIVTTRSQTVEADRVHILTEIRDMTAQEIDDRDTAVAQGVLLGPEGKAIKGIHAVVFALVNDVRSRHGQAALDVAAFYSFMASVEGGLTDQEFVDQIKTYL